MRHSPFLGSTGKKTPGKKLCAHVWDLRILLGFLNFLVQREGRGQDFRDFIGFQPVGLLQGNFGDQGTDVMEWSGQMDLGTPGAVPG